MRGGRAALGGSHKPRRPLGGGSRHALGQRPEGGPQREPDAGDREHKTLWLSRAYGPAVRDAEFFCWSDFGNMLVKG